jgi:hypothetical protein
MQKARWSTAVAAAALLALPVAASAQSTQSTPQQNPPAQQAQPPSQPPAQPPSQPPSTAPQQPPATTAQPPATTPEQPPTAAAPAGQVDQSAAKTHLSEARDTLSQLTAMPEAAKLQGAARTQVSQLISDFNAMITAQSDWRASYAKVDADLTAVLGPEAKSGDQPVGTSGTTPPAASDAVQIDPALRAKLGEFRTHLKEFEKAAGGSAAPSASTAVTPTTGSDPAASVPPSAPTPTTSSPATPGEPKPNPANPSSSVGTSGVSASSPTGSMDPSDRARAESAVSAASPAPNADAQKELDAISSILSGSKTGALTKAQTAEIKKHVENLRVLLAQK